MNAPLPSARLWRILFLPFAAGYFLSYLYRSANAVIGPGLADELGLHDAGLGLLTSTYFLAFGAAQLPLGLALDRFGPRKAEASLLLVAALGALVFALAEDLAMLATGRALIGLGVSACLMASFKAFALWFPPERQASLTGAVMSAGGLGALAAARPLELALGIAGWREIFLVLAVLTVLCAAALFLLAPERATHPQGAGLGEQVAAIFGIYRSRVFWRYAPLGVFFVGGFMALQGLWATRWMMSVEGLSRAAAADRLTLMSLAMLAGFLFMAFFATPLARRGLPPARLFTLSLGLATAALALIVVAPTTGGGLAWTVLAIGFSFSNLGYGLIAGGFPLALSGRANTAYNLFIFLGAFALQWGLGALIDALQAGGADEAGAYRVAFGLLLSAIALSYGWLLAGGRPGMPPSGR